MHSAEPAACAGVWGTAQTSAKASVTDMQLESQAWLPPIMHRFLTEASCMSLLHAAHLDVLTRFLLSLCPAAAGDSCLRPPASACPARCSQHVSAAGGKSGCRA